VKAFISKTIVKKANYAIILCRDDCKVEIGNWRKFFAKLNVPVICIAVSKLTGLGKVEIKDIIHATLVGLDRTPRVDEVTISLAVLIKEKLEL
jgi:hypothetical protein